MGCKASSPPRGDLRDFAPGWKDRARINTPPPPQGLQAVGRWEKTQEGKLHAKPRDWSPWQRERGREPPLPPHLELLDGLQGLHAIGQRLLQVLPVGHPELLQAGEHDAEAPQPARGPPAP